MTRSRVYIDLRLSGGRLLEQLTDPSLPGYLTTRFPGGKIEAGETPVQAAMRELREEFNVTVSEDACSLTGGRRVDRWGAGPIVVVDNHGLGPGDYQPPGQRLTRLIFDSFTCECEGGPYGEEVQCYKCGKEGMH